MMYIIIVLIVLLLTAIFIFNRFVRLKNRAEEAWADISVQLKRRYDLIPNLVNTVKGYAAHESTAFEKVTEARSRAMGAGGGVAATAKAENELAGALRSVIAIAEAYPDLKANQNFLSLQNELSDTENKIQAARRFYNVNVRDLNTGLESFPGNLIGNMFGFKKMEFFELGANEQAAQNPVEVKF